MKRIDLEIGTKFNSWTVLENIYNTGKYGMVKVQCDCGEIKIHNKHAIKNGIIKKCKTCSLPEEGLSRRKGIGEMSGYYWTCVNNNAQARNLSFNITKEYAYSLFTGKCALSGLDISLDNYTKNSGTASLDRIDNTIGYEVGNIQWVHKDVNNMKMGLPEDRLIFLCKEISKNNVSIN